MDRKTAEAIGRLGGRIDRLETTLRAEITALGERIEESHRHSQVLIESLREDIKLLADGFAQLSAKIARR